jgi:predicted nucleic acid-binding protein
MSKPRAYIETTAPNFYYDFRPSPEIERRREATRRWWTGAAERYELVTSLTVRSELAAGTSNRVTQRLALLEGIRLIEFVPPVAEIVRHYLAHKLMPSKPQADAIHLALASYYKCDFIVSWNSRQPGQPEQG